MINPADLVTALASARKAVQLYPPAHPAHGEALGVFVEAVKIATVEQPFVLNWHQGRLYHESRVVPDDAPGVSSIADLFESRHIESIAFTAEFGQDDAEALGEVLGLRPSPTLDVQAELDARGVRGVNVSRLDDEADDERKERDRQRQADRAMYQRVIAALRQLRDRFAAGQSADLAETFPLVAGVMDRLMADPAAVMGLATIRGVGDRSLFHSLNVMIYTLALGQRLGIPEEGLASLGLSALMHDIGKSAFIEDDPAQLEPMRLMHPEAGAKILQRVAFEDPAPLLVAYEHHMNRDGSGWPERDEGYISHPYSRMVAVANRYENLINTDGTEEALTPDKAVVQVLREAATTLDPFFARLFADALGVFPVGCLVRLSDHSVGVVTIRGEDLLAPRVRMTYDTRGTEIADPYEVDLSESELRIVEVIDPEYLNVDVSDKL
jgi:HD-GYP domain-containing protein (c-di-GMP phosphodiesterase class II)